jgi:AbrB family looped-hinge helix DNA binding protein
MKSLGIIRRIDPLGRITIPMEIRRNHGWEEGAPLELHDDNGSLVLKPFLKEQEVHEQLGNIAKIMQEVDLSIEQNEALEAVYQFIQKQGDVK